MKKETVEIILYTHPIIQEMQINFYKQKLKDRGFSNHWNLFVKRKGIAEGTYENWRREFTRKELLKAKMFPVTLTRGKEK